MENYASKLEREVIEIKNNNPQIKEIIETIKNILRKSTIEFDYEIERTWLMYNEVNKILNSK